MLDLFVGYDHRTLDTSSRDLTTIQSPIGAMRLTCLPQGWTNAGAIFHEDVTFILEPEIPDTAWPFMDDCSIKGPATRYETGDGGYETIPANDQVRRFVWEHLNDVHRILHRLRCAGATVSAKKLFVAVPEVIILGHKCNYDGRIPDDSKIAKIRDWPDCKSLSDVRAFLGLAGYMRIWIKNYSSIARPLVDLTRKGAPFIWHEEHEQAMQTLRTTIIQSPALISIDYSTDRPVYLSVDSSIRGVGWILSQDCSDGRRRPSRFGSLSWNERESRYSQAKLELYGLFRALRALRLHLVGTRNLIVEVDASYIKGMISNPDIQPNAAINRWIAAILLFDFKLVHVPADKHCGPDSLSRREPAPNEEEEDDPEDWVDHVLSLGIWVVSWLDTSPADQPSATALTLAFETDNDGNDDTIRLRRPHREHRLPARYRTGEYLHNDNSRPHVQPRPVARTMTRATPTISNNNSLLSPDIRNVDNNNNNNNNINIDNNNNNNNFNIDSNNNSLLSINNRNTENVDGNNNSNSNSLLPQASTNSDDVDNPSNDDSAPITFSTSDKANKADLDIEHIRRYLLSRRAPSELSGDELTRFISRTR
jgi:hypothetical protein